MARRAGVTLAPSAFEHLPARVVLGRAWPRKEDHFRAPQGKHRIIRSLPRYQPQTQTRCQPHRVGCQSQHEDPTKPTPNGTAAKAKLRLGKKCLPKKKRLWKAKRRAPKPGRKPKRGPNPERKAKRPGPTIPPRKPLPTIPPRKPLPTIPPRKPLPTIPPRKPPPPTIPPRKPPPPTIPPRKPPPPKPPPPWK